MGALPASLQKFLRGRKLQVVTVALKHLAPASQQGQGAHLSRDETPNNFMLLGPEDHDPQHNSTTALFALCPFRSSVIKDKRGLRRAR